MTIRIILIIFGAVQTASAVNGPTFVFWQNQNQEKNLKQRIEEYEANKKKRQLTAQEIKRINESIKELIKDIRNTLERIRDLLPQPKEPGS